MKDNSRMMRFSQVQPEAKFGVTNGRLRCICSVKKKAFELIARRLSFGVVLRVAVSSPVKRTTSILLMKF